MYNNNNPEIGNKDTIALTTHGLILTINFIITSYTIIPTCAGVGGNWRRIAKIDISKGYNCCNGWLKDTQSGVNFCRVAQNNYGFCSSTFFSTNGTSYQKV